MAELALLDGLIGAILGALIGGVPAWIIAGRANRHAARADEHAAHANDIAEQTLAEARRANELPEQNSQRRREREAEEVRANEVLWKIEPHGAGHRLRNYGTTTAYGVWISPRRLMPWEGSIDASALHTVPPSDGINLPRDDRLTSGSPTELYVYREGRDEPEIVAFPPG